MTTIKDGKRREHLRVGDLVRVVQKKDQRTGQTTEGLIKRILTNKPFHPHGIKVLLDTGEVGRVQELIPEDIDPLPQ